MQIDHLALHVYDLQESASFYEKVLGLERVPEPFHDNLHVWLRIGPHTALHLVAGAAGIRKDVIDTHLAFRVDSLDHFMETLNSAGIPYRSFNGDAKVNNRPDGVRQTYLQDPNGYWLEVNDAKL
ncbi:MAG TPA: VOC family protein [Acidisarcina sp.]